MGCYNETCAISNLPITCGMPTYLILLAESPNTGRKGNTGIYVNDHWFLRSIPILGTYNDYGEIEGWEQGWVHDILLQQFHKDLIEDPPQEKEFSGHAVAHKKSDINFSQILEWLHEGQLKVDGRKIGSGPAELSVVKGFIRKDVWDICLNAVNKDWHGEYSMSQMKSNVNDYISLLKEAKNSAAEKLKGINDPDSIESKFFKLEIHCKCEEIWHSNNFIGPFFASPGIGPAGTPGIKDYKIWVDEKFISGEISEAEAYQKYLRIAEVIHVQNIMGDLRKNWHPTSGTGSQSADYDLAMNFNLDVAALAYKEQIQVLSEQMGFSEEDFDNTTEKGKKQREALIKCMSEVRNETLQLKSVAEKFANKINEIDSDITEANSEE